MKSTNKAGSTPSKSWTLPPPPPPPPSSASQHQHHHYQQNATRDNSRGFATRGTRFRDDDSRRNFKPRSNNLGPRTGPPPRPLTSQPTAPQHHHTNAWPAYGGYGLSTTGRGTSNPTPASWNSTSTPRMSSTSTNRWPSDLHPPNFRAGPDVPPYATSNSKYPSPQCSSNSDRGVKRKHESTAIYEPSRTHNYQSNNPSHSQKKSKKPKRLGLNLKPECEQDIESNEDDSDEEAKLSKAHGHSFLHNGVTYDLKSKQQVAAWIAERKKNAPSKYRKLRDLKEASAKAVKNAAERHRVSGQLNGNGEEASVAADGLLKSGNTTELHQVTDMKYLQTSDTRDTASNGQNRPASSASATPAKADLNKPSLSSIKSPSNKPKQTKHPPDRRKQYNSKLKPPPKYMSLHQRLIRQEREEEHRRVLDAIRFLGAKGLLDR